MADSYKSVSIFTVGHSTRTFEELFELLLESQVRCLVDVRSYPASRRHPQFNLEALRGELGERGGDYIHMKSLGGRRPAARKDSPNQGWQSRGFRNYADYMMGSDFKKGIEDLLKVSSQCRTAIMCAEAYPYRCHRRLISDFLALIKQVPVLHIFSKGRLEEHVPAPFADRRGDQLLYFAPQGELFL